MWQCNLARGFVLITAFVGLSTQVRNHRTTNVAVCYFHVSKRANYVSVSYLRDSKIKNQKAKPPVQSDGRTLFGFALIRVLCIPVVNLYGIFNEILKPRTDLRHVGGIDFQETFP